MKTQKLKILSRTNTPINIPWYKSPVVHDFETMAHREKISIDFNHDNTKPIGYARVDKVDESGLWLDGVIIPDGKDGEDIINKLREGVPFEASITHDGEFDLVEVPDGETVEVNAFSYTGPLGIISNWNLRNVALCLIGADKFTEVVNYSNTTNLTQEKVQMKMVSLEEQKNYKASDKDDKNIAEGAEAPAEEATKPVEAAAEETTPVVEVVPVEAEKIEEPEEEKDPVDVAYKTLLDILINNGPEALLLVLEAGPDADIKDILSEFSKKELSDTVARLESELATSKAYSLNLECKLSTNAIPASPIVDKKKSSKSIFKNI